MLDQLFTGLFDSATQTVIAPADFLLCLGVSLALGLLLALCYLWRSRSSGSFVMTLALLPAVVCVVIMLVNGNIGTGVAVAGAFSLVRFRSAPGSAREIGAIFIAMGAGLAAGMGYLAYAFLFVLVLGLVSVLYTASGFGTSRKAGAERVLRVTIPEDLDYTEVFDDIFAQFTEHCERTQVKTTGMGSLFRLTYRVTLRDSAEEKHMLDALRCRNGNLEVSLARREPAEGEL